MRRDREAWQSVSASESWHDLAHLPRISANLDEWPGTSKKLKQKEILETACDFNALKLASQAYDEGSIPFTRSIFSKHLDNVASKIAPKLHRLDCDLRGSRTKHVASSFAPSRPRMYASPIAWNSLLKRRAPPKRG
jgi:hypothetical protein